MILLAALLTMPEAPAPQILAVAPSIRSTCTYALESTVQAQAIKYFTESADGSSPPIAKSTACKLARAECLKRLKEDFSCNLLR